MDELDGLPAPFEAADATWEDVAALLLDIDSPLIAAPSKLLDADWQPSLHHDQLCSASDVVAGGGTLAAGIDALPALLDVDAKSGGSEEVSVSSASTSASASDEQTSTPLHEGALSSRRRQYREKKKAEMRELRALAAALTDKVVAMEKRTHARGVIGVVAGWRGVALRQMRRRREAEALNRELRAQIRQYRGLTLQLIDMLRSRTTPLPSQRTAAFLCPQQQKPVMVLDDSDRRLIDTFRRELSDIYPRADDVLRDSNMPELGPGADHAIRHGRRWDCATGSEYVEVAEAQVVPFTLADAIYAMHKAMPFLFGRECEPALFPLPESAYDFAAKFQFRSAGNAAVQYDCVFVTKAVDEKDRWVFVWRALTTESAVAGADSSTGASFLDEGWGTARALPSDSGGRSPGTIFEFYTRSRLYLSSSSAPGSARLEEYLQEMVASAPNEAVELSQAMENVLVDDMAALSVSRGSDLTVAMLS